LLHTLCALGRDDTDFFRPVGKRVVEEVSVDYLDLKLR
jgi:hypothetical protein